MLLGYLEQLENSEERADELHALAELQSDSLKGKMAALKNANVGLRAEIFEFTIEADLKRVTLQHELQKKNSSTIL